MPPEAALLRRLEARPPQRILLVQSAWLGDTVFTSALAAGLAARFPAARLEACTSPRGRDVAQAMPGVAEVVVFDKKGVDRGARGLARVAAARLDPAPPRCQPQGGWLLRRARPPRARRRG